MNNCYSSLGSINGNPKEQNCGDRRCDMGINPNPLHRGARYYGYSTDTSQDRSNLGKLAQGYVDRELTKLTPFNRLLSRRLPFEGAITNFNTSELTKSATTAWNFQKPGRFVTVSGEAFVTQEEAEYFIKDLEHWRQTGFGLTGSTVPLLYGSEPLALIGPAFAGGMVAQASAMSLTSMFRTPLIEINPLALLGNGSLFSIPEKYNPVSGVRLMGGVHVQKMNFQQNNLSIYQQRGGTAYYGEGFEIEVITIENRFENNSNQKSKIILVPFYSTDYTWYINPSNSIVFAAKSETYQSGGLGYAEVGASLEFLHWNLCSSGKKTLGWKFGVYLDHSWRIMGQSSQLTRQGSNFQTLTPEGSDGGSMGSIGISRRIQEKQSTTVYVQLEIGASALSNLIKGR